MWYFTEMKIKFKKIKRYKKIQSFFKAFLKLQQMNTFPCNYFFNFTCVYPSVL